MKNNFKIWKYYQIKWNNSSWDKKDFVLCEWIWEEKIIIRKVGINYDMIEETQEIEIKSISECIDIDENMFFEKYIDEVEKEIKNKEFDLKKLNKLKETRLKIQDTKSLFWKLKEFLKYNK